MHIINNLISLKYRLNEKTMTVFNNKLRIPLDTIVQVCKLSCNNNLLLYIYSDDSLNLKY